MTRTELTQPEVERELVGIASRLLDIDPSKISVESPLEGGDLPFDSLGVAEFTMAIEEEFEVEIKDDAHAVAFPGQPMTLKTVAVLIMEARGE